MTNKILNREVLAVPRVAIGNFMSGHDIGKLSVNIDDVKFAVHHLRGPGHGNRYFIGLYPKAVDAVHLQYPICDRSPLLANVGNVYCQPWVKVGDAHPTLYFDTMFIVGFNPL
ncbi:MAG: hypothetical protein AB4352_27960 [Hormoscilla sp.]